MPGGRLWNLLFLGMMLGVVSIPTPPPETTIARPFLDIL